VLIELLDDGAAFARVGPEAITTLTDRATRATFYVEGLSAEQLEANQRVVRIAAETALGACREERQLFTAAFVDRAFAGYMIATVHAPDDRELDWLMVDPAYHGSGVAGALMKAGVEWLGFDRPMWLNVIQHNHRAIRFYRRHGFEVDPDAKTNHAIPHFIMRREPPAEAA
jgi:ribosomal protein S18 acetylase RimI-like enzyme